MFVIAGPSGVGKGSIANELQAHDESLVLSRSWTTRERRQGERSDAYRFVGRKEFEDHAASGGFLEWAEVFGHLYGTPRPEPLPGGKDLLLEIDVQGATQVKAIHPDAVVIFIVPPSRQAQEQRLRGRGDPEEVIAERLARADEEERRGRELADHVVVNDVLPRAVAEVAAIVESARAARSPTAGEARDA